MHSFLETWEKNVSAFYFISYPRKAWGRRRYSSYTPGPLQYLFLFNADWKYRSRIFAGNATFPKIHFSVCNRLPIIIPYIGGAGKPAFRASWDRTLIVLQPIPERILVYDVANFTNTELCESFADIQMSDDRKIEFLLPSPPRNAKFKTMFNQNETRNPVAYQRRALTRSRLLFEEIRQLAHRSHASM